MDNWKEDFGALLGVLIAIVWLALELVRFPILIDITLNMVFAVLVGGLYAISALKNKILRGKKSVK